jgi:hypothetical protein
MTRPVLFAVLTATAFAAVPAALVTPAQAQIEVQIGTAPPRNGAWGDRDRDGVPNVYDRYDNRRTWNNGAWGDRDHDGVPNAYDRFDNRALRDKDHDGVPQAWDRNDNNPWRR